MQRRHESWRKIDELTTAYIPLSDYEKNVTSKGKDKGQLYSKNKPVSIVVPNSFATQETILTYLTEAFLANPIFRYEGTGTEDAIGAKLLELLVNYQIRRLAAPLIMHAAFANCIKYGLAPTTFEWYQKFATRPTREEKVIYNSFGEPVDRIEEEVLEETLIFEGNRISNIDPYRYLPDPNVAAEWVREGEFVGWTEPVTVYKLLSQERWDDTLFNVRYMLDIKKRFTEDMTNLTSKYSADQSGRNTKHGGSPGDERSTTHTRYITQLHQYVTIIPREWGLGSSEYPETWLFTLLDDILLVRARKVDMYHGDAPIAVAAPDSDGFSPTPTGRIELMAGLQGVLDWLFNSHIANVRKALNDMLVVDPSLIVMKDLENPEPGKLVRLRRAAWGRGAKDAVSQLVVNDITRQNISDASFVMDIMQRVSAATDATQGIIRAGGERRSATEYRTTVSNAVSRLAHVAKMISWQYMQPLAYYYASHTQQYMSQEVRMQVTGSWPDLLKETYGVGSDVVIDPSQLSVNFDIVELDGTTPNSGVANADIWVQPFQMVSADQDMRLMFDVPRMFEHIAMLLGAPNVFDFVRKGGDIAARVVEDDLATEGARKGDLVPLSAIQ